MAVVYVVQEPHWRNPKTKVWGPKYDLASAEDFGRLEFLLDPTDRPDDPAALLDTLEEGLRDIQDGDFILLIGNPVLIALTAVMAADNVDRINFLQWDGRTRLYSPIGVDFS